MDTLHKGDHYQKYHLVDIHLCIRVSKLLHAQGKHKHLEFDLQQIGVLVIKVYLNKQNVKMITSG